MRLLCSLVVLSLLVACGDDSAPAPNRGLNRQGAVDEHAAGDDDDEGYDEDWVDEEDAGAAQLYGAVDQGDIRTIPCQAQGDGSANALPGAGHQRNFSSDDFSSSTHDELLQ